MTSHSRTTMTSATPWEEIDVPSYDYNVRAVRDAGPSPVYWGRNIHGQYLLLVDLDGDYTDTFHRENVAVRGLKIDLRSSEIVGHQRLVLTLESKSNVDLFSAFCDSLVSALRSATDSTSTMQLTLGTLRRWRAFLASGRPDVLSSSEVRGLVCELEVLQQILSRHNERYAVESWVGPFGSPQDFVLSNTAIEVKAVTPRDGNAVRISSEDQLESECAKLLIAVIRLDEGTLDEGAASLNELVSSLSSAISEPLVQELFLDRLMKCGYLPLAEYNTPRYVVKRREQYLVGDTFPKLVRSGLPSAIREVSYSIQIESIRSHLVAGPFLGANDGD
ncbi:MAG: PD-(D/E)XK motif protein [Acidimicrobiia bacterium]